MSILAQRPTGQQCPLGPPVLSGREGRAALLAQAGCSHGAAGETAVKGSRTALAGRTGILCTWPLRVPRPPASSGLFMWRLSSDSHWKLPGIWRHRLGTGSLCLPRHSAVHSKPQVQPGPGGWGNTLHHLLGGTAESCAKGTHSSRSKGVKRFLQPVPDAQK